MASERGYQVAARIAERASGLNEHRRGMKKLFQLIDQQAIDVVLIEDPDRLVRFGFGYLEEKVAILDAARCFYLDFFLTHSFFANQNHHCEEV